MPEEDSKFPGRIVMFMVMEMRTSVLAFMKEISLR